MDSQGRVQVAVVGFGYWGPNLVRNFSLSDGAAVTYVCDLQEDRLARAARMFPMVRTTISLQEVLDDPAVDLIAVATPVSTHYKLAITALKAGKHVLVEKPLAASSNEARDILATARAAGRRVFVDHTFIFTPAVRKMRSLFERGEIGKPLYYDSVRINLGLFQHDVNVVWDLVTHDIAILDHILDGRMPTTASCTGMAHFGGKHADLAYLTLKYDDEFVAHINVNWLAPVKVRQVLLCGDKRMVVYDDNLASEKVKVYDSGVQLKAADEVYDMMVQYRTGDMVAPRLDNTEALGAEVSNIVNTIRGEEQPMCGGEMGLRVVQILEAADASLRLHGRPIRVGPERRARRSLEKVTGLDEALDDALETHGKITRGKERRWLEGQP